MLDLEATSLPVLDLGALRDGRRAEAVRETRAAFESHGYLLVEGHGIAPALFGEVYALTERLFALPESVKLDCAPESARGLAGYVLGDPNERAARASETTEMWQIQRPFEDPSARHPSIPENVWPRELSELRSPALALFAALDACAKQVLAALDEGLELRAGLHGSEPLAPGAEDGWAILRLMRYPPRSPETSLDRPRASAHDDMCLLTCYTGGSRSGLEVLQPDGSWARVPAGERYLLIGAGSMLHAATNGVIRPATHRVVYDPGDPGVRYATPFFLLPRPDAGVGPRLLAASGGFPRYPDRTAANMLAIATGWTDDEAAARHDEWRTGSPAPDPRTVRVTREGATSLSFMELEVADLHRAGDVARRLFEGSLHLVLVRRAFAAEQMLALRHRLERGTPPLARLAFPAKFHAFFLGGNLDLSDELAGYLELAARFEDDARILGGAEVDLARALPGLLSALAGGRPLDRPRGPNGQAYLLASIRELLEGGHIPPHCECEQLARAPYGDLGPRIDRTTLLSYYTMIDPPLAGGELVVHELAWDEVRGEHVQNARTEVRELLARAARPSLRVRPLAGDLLLFDGGRLIHEVRPVEKGKRWTLGGCMGRDTEGRLLFWA
ncbi:MAG: 2OG-Fe(II) oxygenase [Sandaracinaceae bacterium]|nr:2OG-Fe(II) oxygenase [Sandaracinaceae bacterium]